MTAATATLQARAKVPALEAMGEVLLGWGALSSLLYAGADALAAWRYPGYDVASRAIGELGAIGAPTRMLAVALGLAYAVLVVGFGAAVWECARGNRALRATGALLVAYGVVGLAAPFFPLHARAAPASLADQAGVALAAASLVLALAQLAFGSEAGGRAFRIYSLATFAVVLALGVAGAWQAPRMAEGLATPWFGLVERAGVAAYLLWVAVLDGVLMRAEARAFATRYLSR